MTSHQDVLDVLAGVPDPEIPVLSVVDLGIVRDVAVSDATVEVTLTPTYMGCPATLPIREAVASVLRERFGNVAVHVSLAAWTTDLISAQGRRRLDEYGIAPPNPAAHRPERCPRCGSSNTAVLSDSGSTPCKALYRCRACREPFEYFKCL